MMVSRMVLAVCLTVMMLSAGLASTTTDFSASPLSGGAPLRVQFTDLSTDSPTAWTWSFGDGATATVQNPVHTYVGPGCYSIIFSTPGAGAVKRDFITVTKPGHWISVAAAASKYVVAAGGSVSLSATAHDSAGYAIASWLWSDGGKGGKFTPS